jgi:uncharacterized iron-regulated membrane protein
MRVRQMDSLFFVVLLAVGLSIVCVLYSTWTTVNDLRELVGTAQESQMNNRASHRWQDIATRTIEHIEHTAVTRQAINTMPASLHGITAGILVFDFHSCHQ